MNGTQLVCCSATLPSTLDSTIGIQMNMAEDMTQLSTQNVHTLHSNIKHIFYRISKFERDHKIMELVIESIHHKKPVIIFSNRNEAVNWLFNYLNENNIYALRLVSDMTEEERIASFQSFQEGVCDVMVASDLASRGLDTIRV